MQSINSTQGVHVHADLSELNRIRQQLSASQLAIWGDHSSRIAAMFGMANNDIADLIFNDCGLVIWAVENPELGLAVSAGLTAVWMQLANLNSLCDLVENRYQAGELSIDRKMALEHQLFEVAAVGPLLANLKLGLSIDRDVRKARPIRPIESSPVCAPDQPPTSSGGAGGSATAGGSAGAGLAGGSAGGSGGAATSHNRVDTASHAGVWSDGLKPDASRRLSLRAEPIDLQDSEQPEGASGYKGSSTQN